MKKALCAVSMRSTNFSVLAGLALIVFLGCSQVQLKSRPDTSREAAPNFTLTDTNGIAHSLREYAGKVVILNFWAPWCFNCVGELKALEELKVYLDDVEFEVLAITEGARNEVSGVKYKFPVVFDENKKVSEDYNVGMLPVSYVLDKRGHIVSFPDPDHEGEAKMFQGPRGWNSLKVVRDIRLLAEE